MVTRIHHCLADGIAGVGVMNVIMDTAPTPPAIAVQKPQIKPQAPQKDATAVILNGLAKSYLSLVTGAHAAHRTAERSPGGGCESGRSSGGDDSYDVRAGGTSRAFAV